MPYEPSPLHDTGTHRGPGRDRDRKSLKMNVKERQPTLGSLLRLLRFRNKWTLTAMSKRSGIPISTLSKVERDRLTLTYDKLVLLSQRLNIPISELFVDLDVDTAVTARRSIGRIGTAVRVNTKTYDYYYLCPELRRKRIVPVVVRIRSKSAEEAVALLRHSGEKYIYVLEGGFKLVTEFYDPVVLGVGESIYIDSKMGHSYVAAQGCDEAVVLVVCSSAEERLMESLLSLHGETPGQTMSESR